MAVGLGIHGEPGIDETGIPTADGLAELLVARLLDEVPDGVDGRGARASCPILNGLGSLKYEEMFVVYRRIAELLDDAGVEIVDPHVGEYCTSFDMAGHVADAVLAGRRARAAVGHPRRHPAYRRGSVVAAAQRRRSRVDAEAAAVTPAGERRSRAVGTLGRRARWRHRRDDRHPRRRARPPRPDRRRRRPRHRHAARRPRRAGCRAVAAETRGRRRTVLVHAGDAWSDRAGGTSGALWGVILALDRRDDRRRGRRRARHPSPRASPPRAQGVMPTARPRWATRPWSTPSCRSAAS